MQERIQPFILYLNSVIDFQFFTGGCGSCGSCSGDDGGFYCCVYYHDDELVLGASLLSVPSAPLAQQVHQTRPVIQHPDPQNDLPKHLYRHPRASHRNCPVSLQEQEEVGEHQRQRQLLAEEALLPPPLLLPPLPPPPP
jgi:hypothetical protein